MSGRFINEDISRSDKIGSLTPKSLALFCLMIPHLNAHGKMVGGPGYIKDLICPKVKWLNHKIIGDSLKEISQKTNVKWFKNNGLWYLHSLNWSDHQPGLRRLGQDKLPDYSRTTPELVPPEVDYIKDKDKDKDYIKPSGGFSLFWSSYPLKVGKGKAEQAWDKINPDSELRKVIMAKIIELKKSEQWQSENGKYIPHPTTWLNRKGWFDEYIRLEEDSWRKRFLEKED